MGNANYKTNHNHRISSNVIGALTALLITYHNVQLQSDSVIGQLAVIGHFEQLSFSEVFSAKYTN